MAEFCTKCARKIGVMPDEKPLFCEGCGVYFKKRWFWDWLKKIAKKQ